MNGGSAASDSDAFAKKIETLNSLDDALERVKWMTGTTLLRMLFIVCQAWKEGQHPSSFWVTGLLLLGLFGAGPYHLWKLAKAVVPHRSRAGWTTDVNKSPAEPDCPQRAKNLAIAYVAYCVLLFVEFIVFLTGDLVPYLNDDDVSYYKLGSTLIIQAAILICCWSMNLVLDVYRRFLAK